MCIERTTLFRLARLQPEAATTACTVRHKEQTHHLTRALQVVLCALVLLASSVVEAKVPQSVLKQKQAIIAVSVLDLHGEQIGGGSGFVVDTKGFIATTHQLASRWIESVDNSIVLTREDGTSIAVEEMVFSDQRYNVAILRTKDEKLPAVTLSAGPVPGLGENVFIMGIGLGTNKTSSKGTVVPAGAKGDLFQIHSDLPPEGSGSPVFNARGEVIGMTVLTGIAQQGPSLNVAVSVKHISNITNAETQLELGRLRGESGRYSEALKAFKRAIRLRPDYADAYHDLGVTLSRLEMHNEALDAYLRAAELRPKRPETHEYLGKTYLLLGRYTEAVEEYQTALTLNPQNVETHLLLGFAYQELSLNHSALKAYEEAIRIAPDFPDSYVTLGAFYAKFGNYTEAEKALKKALAIKPDHAEAHFRLGLLHLIAGNETAAREEYIRLREIDKNLADTLNDQIGAPGQK